MNPHYAVKITLYASETDNCKASKPTKKIIRVIAGTLGVAKSTVWTGELINIIRLGHAWKTVLDDRWIKLSQVELYCHSATCGYIKWNETPCLTGPRCYINTDIQQ